MGGWVGGWDIFYVIESHLYILQNADHLRSPGDGGCQDQFES